MSTQRTNANAQRQPKVIIAGAGMAGLLMGIRLQRAGIDSFEIIEAADRVGGTWRDNTYPGLACDVPAHTYTYSFQPNPRLTHRYARGPQIQAYFERVADDYGLNPHIRFNRKIERAVFERGGWNVTTSDGETRRADFFIGATGPLDTPRSPEFSGGHSFAGETFHSARWDHDVALDGKRIGVIGTGSTAVQITCALAARAQTFSLFQRTPQWVCPQFDKPYSAFSQWLNRNIPGLAWLRGQMLRIGFESTFSRAVVGDKKMFALIKFMCRRNLAKVRDPELRSLLTPDYTVGCKRLIFSDKFYHAIQEPGAGLVTAGIERIEPRGIVTEDGKLHELDVLVYATGFGFPNISKMDVVGEHGRSLAEIWEGAPRAYRTVAMPNFPNFFMIFGPHSPGGNYSLINSSEDQTHYIMQMISAWQNGEFDTAAPKPEVEKHYTDSVIDGLRGTVWVVGGCRSWYQDASGLPNLWPWSPKRFRHEMQQPELASYELRRSEKSEQDLAA